MPSLLSFVATVAFALTTVAGVDALVKGHDLSSAVYMETNEGVTWYNEAGTKASIESILGAGGMQSVRLR